MVAALSVANVVTLNPPSLEVVVDASGAYSAKSWSLLESAALRFASFPADAEIVRSYAWSQQMADYPPGCYGDLTWAVYPRLYGDLSGIPGRERCQPIGPWLLGRLLFRPGADVLDWRDHPEPIPYRPGDRIGMFPEIAGAPYRPLSIFTGLIVRSATGFDELPGIVYHDPPNRSAWGQGAYSFRCTASEIPAGGNEVRVTVAALGEGLNLSHMSIGRRNGASGFNMVASPVPVTFGGAAGFSLAPHASWRSDWVALTTQPGDALLIHSCVSGSWVYKDVSTADGNPGCYVAGTSGHDAQTFSGTVQVINGTHHRKHVVAMIEVR